MLDENNSAAAIARGVRPAARPANLLMAAVDTMNVVLRWAVGLIAMDTLTTALSPRNGWKVKLFAYLVTIGFFVFLIVVGMRWLEFGFMESSTVMDVPMSLVYLSMPVGGVLAVINIVVRAIEGHRNVRLLGHDVDTAAQ